MILLTHSINHIISIQYCYYSGDLVHGLVSEITPEGITVSVTSLGTLNITGIIPKKDLPKQVTTYRFLLHLF